MTGNRLPYRGDGSDLVKEVRLLKTLKHGWRWDVTSFWTAQTNSPGVYDGRIHIGREFGYTRTRRGAVRKISRALTS